MSRRLILSRLNWGTEGTLARAAGKALRLLRQHILGPGEAHELAFGILDGLPIGGLEFEHRERAGWILLGNSLLQSRIPLADQPERQPFKRGIVTDEQHHFGAVALVAQRIEQLSAIAEIIDRIIDDELWGGLERLRHELPGIAGAPCGRA